MSMVYCRSCGNQVHETVRFCPDCGASQTQASSSSIQDSVSQAIKKSDFPPITEFLFSSKGRVTRFQLWMSLVANFVIQLFLFQMAKSSDNIGILIIYTVVIIYPAIVILIKRCRDIGLSPKYLWLLLVPLIGFIPLLALLFSESDGENIYNSSSTGTAPKNINPTARDDSLTTPFKSDDSIVNGHSIIDNKPELPADNLTEFEQASAQINQTTMQQDLKSSNIFNEESSVKSNANKKIESVVDSTQTPAKKNIFTGLLQLGVAFLVLGLVVFLIVKLANYKPSQSTQTLPQNEPEKTYNNDSNTIVNQAPIDNSISARQEQSPVGSSWNIVFKEFENNCNGKGWGSIFDFEQSVLSYSFNKEGVNIPSLRTEPPPSYMSHFKIGKPYAIDGSEEKNATLVPNDEEGDSWTNFVFPIVNGDYYGIPIKTIILSRPNGGVNGATIDTLILNLSLDKVMLKLKQQNIDFTKDNKVTLNVNNYPNKDTTVLYCVRN